MKKENHCTGCTEKSWDLPEGRTHQMGTIEHPEVQKECKHEWGWNTVSDKKVCGLCGIEKVQEKRKQCEICEKMHTPTNDGTAWCRKESCVCVCHKEVESWEEVYCKEFGLCEDGEKCQCKDELKFIRNLLQEENDKWENSIKFYMQEAVQNRDREIVEWIDRNKKDEHSKECLSSMAPCEECEEEYGYNQALEDLKNLLMK